MNIDDIRGLTFGEYGITIQGYIICGRLGIERNRYEILRALERVTETADAVKHAMRRAVVLLRETPNNADMTQLELVLREPEITVNHAEYN